MPAKRHKLSTSLIVKTMCSNIERNSSVDAASHDNTIVAGIFKSRLLALTASSCEGTAHCLEGAIFGAAALRANGFPPLILDLEADHDTDHVVAIYRVDNHWGAIAKSNFTGCRYREPVYRSLRELAMSYFNLYFNLRRQRTLRTFSRPVNLARFDHLNWMTTDKPVWFIAEYLCQIPHISLLTSSMKKN